MITLVCVAGAVNAAVAKGKSGARLRAEEPRWNLRVKTNLPKRRFYYFAVLAPVPFPCCLMTFIASEIIDPTSLRVAGRIRVFPV